MRTERDWSVRVVKWLIGHTVNLRGGVVFQRIVAGSSTYSIYWWDGPSDRKVLIARDDNQLQAWKKAWRVLRRASDRDWRELLDHCRRNQMVRV